MFILLQLATKMPPGFRTAAIVSWLAKFLASVSLASVTPGWICKSRQFILINGLSDLCPLLGKAVFFGRVILLPEAVASQTTIINQIHMTFLLVCVLHSVKACHSLLSLAVINTVMSIGLIERVRDACAYSPRRNESKTLVWRLLSWKPSSWQKDCCIDLRIRETFALVCRFWSVTWTQGNFFVFGLMESILHWMYNRFECWCCSHQKYWYLFPTPTTLSYWHLAILLVYFWCIRARKSDCSNKLLTILARRLFLE